VGAHPVVAHLTELTRDDFLTAFTSATAEAPRGIRINVISPNVLENSPGYHSLFAGQRPVTDAEIARAYTLAVQGLVTGRVITV